ncbi:ER membrane protein complex subunit 10 [Pseudoscourfieldia marina]
MAPSLLGKPPHALKKKSNSHPFALLALLLLACVSVSLLATTRTSTPLKGSTPSSSLSSSSSSSSGVASLGVASLPRDSAQVLSTAHRHLAGRWIVYKDAPPPPTKQRPEKGDGKKGGASKTKGNARAELLFDMKAQCKATDMQKRRDVTGCWGVASEEDELSACPADGYPVEHITFDGQLRTSPPSGCKEAWITTLCDDGFLPAVLILVHTLRAHSAEPRDIVVVASTAVSKEILDQVRALCVRVVVVDPFAVDPKAVALMTRSQRYRSGYWVVKMFVWRFTEYDKLVHLDGDIFLRNNPDALFCSPVIGYAPQSRDSPASVGTGLPLIGVTPRSSQDAKAGFNAGMFVYVPREETYLKLMARFLAQSEKEMLANSEQDFLNAFFKSRYTVVPIDLIMKHRRIVKEKALWDENRIAGYHMNGHPKPWSPLWRTACAYPDEHGQFIKQYVAFFTEWWINYYHFIGEERPADVSTFHLRPEHDPSGKWASYDPKGANKCDTGYTSKKGE